MPLSLPSRKIRRGKTTIAEVAADISLPARSHHQPERLPIEAAIDISPFAATSPAVVRSGAARPASLTGKRERMTG
uniref:Uncharacterized protein n=1 Tax=Oryza sativa subsp. japonica TaxID=39947 RepID=Q8H4C4_ORYSJ|nr:hypothetical protein [Oryza sativa Japonica Group]BAD31307.1 hypothetical protein [Oryza sativa Japonica Group]